MVVVVVVVVGGPGKASKSLYRWLCFVIQCPTSSNFHGNAGSPHIGSDSSDLVLGKVVAHNVLPILPI